LAIFQAGRDSTQTHRIERFKGLNVAVDPTQIAPDESPDMLNMYVDTSGALVQRQGYKRVFTTSLGAGKVRGLYDYIKNDGTLVKLIHHDTKLYTWVDTGTPTQPTLIYSAMSNTGMSHAFTMGDNLYIMDGTNYLIFNGTAVTPVTGYVPLLRVATPPTGGGTALESKNLLTGTFRQSFSGNATATVYTLTLNNLDASPVTASIDSGLTFNKVETTHFTVNRTLGTVTWITAPPSGVDNVVIQATQTVSSDTDRIKKSVGHFIYSNRVFVYNGNNLYASDTYNPAYFPLALFNRIGRENESITGAVVQYDTAIVYKARSIYGMTLFDDGVRISFPIKQINDAIGCGAQSTLQVINNNGVGLTDTGLYELVGGVVKDERNVATQSRRINDLLLNEANLDSAISIDYDNRYYLALNNKVYLWDYALPTDGGQRGEWYLWDNIPASCFYQNNQVLYFGSNAEGLLYKFSDPDDGAGYNDDGALINAYWKSKLEDFGASELYKTVKKLYYAMKPYTSTAVQVFFIDEDGMTQELGTDGLSLFSYENWNYDNFSYVSSRNPKEYTYKIKAKKITHLQIEFRNGNLNERFGILALEMTFSIKGYYK
jgi:hypothetical protein